MRVLKASANAAYVARQFRVNQKTIRRKRTQFRTAWHMLHGPEGCAKRRYVYVLSAKITRHKTQLVVIDLL